MTTNNKIMLPSIPNESEAINLKNEYHLTACNSKNEVADVTEK